MSELSRSLVQKVQLTDKPFETLRESLIKQTDDAFIHILDHTPPNLVYQRHDVIRINSQTSPESSSQTFYVAHNNAIDLQSLMIEIQVDITVTAANAGKFILINNFFDNIIERFSYKLGYNTLEIDHIGSYNSQWRHMYYAISDEKLSDSSSMAIYGHNAINTTIYAPSTGTDIVYTPAFTSSSGNVVQSSDDFVRTSVILGSTSRATTPGTYTIFGYIRPTHLLFQLHKAYTPYTPIYIEAFRLPDLSQLGITITTTGTTPEKAPVPTISLKKCTMIFDSYELDMKYFSTGAKAIGDYKSNIYKEPTALYESLDSRIYQYPLTSQSGTLNIQFNITLPKCVLFTVLIKDPTSNQLIAPSYVDGNGHKYLLKSYDLKINGISVTNGPINNTYIDRFNNDVEKFIRFKKAFKQNWLAFDIDGPMFSDWQKNVIYAETINPSNDIAITTPTDVGDVSLDYIFDPTIYNNTDGNIKSNAKWFVVFLYEQKWMIDNTFQVSATLPGA